VDIVPRSAFDRLSDEQKVRSCIGQGRSRERLIGVVVNKETTENGRRKVGEADIRSAA